MEQTEQNVPVFDPAAIREMSEEQIDAYGRAYTEAVDRYVRESVARTLAPVMEEIDRKEAEHSLREAVFEMQENQDYYDFPDKLEQVTDLCRNLPVLAAVPPRERLTMAYLMVKGAQAVGEHKSAPVRDPREIADEIWQMPEVMKVLAERRAQAADLELPVFARSAAGAAAVPKKPQTLSDASAEARKHFNL